MRRFVLFAVLAGLGLSTVAWPQASNSTVRGTVRDQGQAIIPGAKVTVVNTATGVARETLSNDAGLYVFPGVIPGSYRLSAEFPGMQKFEGTLTVQVQQDATVDVVLQVAQAVTTVEVLDVTPVLKTDSPSLGHVLERQRIEQLPVNGRSYQALLATVPGLDNTGLIQFYGMRTNSSATLFDGAQTNEVWEGWDFGRTPGLDSIQEFHVEVNNSSAKFMRPVTVLLSSRSGTNAFHGALFETNRNSGYGVARRRQDYFAKPPYLNRNEYGVSAGGPVHLPRVYDGRNRTFWFFAWEASRQISTTTERYNVPTEAMRNGDFRGLADSQGRPFTLYDPLTTDANGRRQPLSFRGVPNMIDPARLSPTAKYLFSITPLPTLPQVNPLIDTNWVGPVRSPTDSDIYSLRIDHRFSDRDHFFMRYALGDNTQEYPYPAQPMLNRVTNLTNRWRPNHTASATWVRTFSPTMTNELLVSGSSDFHRRGAGDYRTNYARDVLGLPNPFQAPNWPAITGLGLGSYTFEGEAPFYLITNYLTVQDNATKIAGKHELQFGFHGRFELVDRNADPQSGGFNVNTLATALIDPASTPTNPIPAALTGHPLANLYLGVMDYGARFRRSWYRFRRQEYAPYFQDNWKVTPRLTLNLGLRYEIRPPLDDRDGTLLTFDFNKRSYVIGTDLDSFIRRGATLPQIVSALRGYGGNIISYQEAGLPEHLVYMNWRHLGPRLGFAYRGLDGARSFVLRGGYRISYYTQKLQDWVGSQSGSPPVGATFQNSVTNTALSPDGLPNYGLRSVPRYIAGVNTPDSIIDINDTRTLTRGFSAQFLDPHYRDGRVQDWNFTIEKEVMANSVVRLSYVGNRTTNIQQWIDYNDQTPEYIWYAIRREPLPTGEFANVARRTYDRQVYGTINLYSPTGWANHNSFTAEFERRYYNGLGFQIYYVTGNTLLTTRDIDDTISADSVPDVNSFLPGAVPTDLKARNRLLNYKRDPVTAKHRVRWNFIADLPFGRGKRLAGNASGPLNKVIGGWQVAGLGHWRTNFFTLPTNIYPTGQPLEFYGYQYPIEDCRSGICYPGYLFWNGYIPANRINSRDASGRPNGIMGVPANYKPAGAPLIPWGATALPANAPAGTNLQSFWDTNTVWIPLNNGTVQRTTFNDNLHPWRNQYMPGVRQWFQDASLFKFVGLTERVSLRFNIDFFNVFNHPNNPTGVGGDGILATRNSGSGARVTQLGLRLSW